MDLSDLKSADSVASAGPVSSSNSKSPGEVRKPVDRELIAAHPEIKAVGSALMDSSGLALSSSKVSQCVVMINLHVFEKASKLKSTSGGSVENKLMEMSEEALINSPETRFTLGFLPNGKRGFREGHDVLVSATVWKTGRRQSYDGPTPETTADGKIVLEKTTNRLNDYILLKVENPTREFLELPVFQMASSEEINNAIASNEKASIFGQPRSLIENGQNIYFQNDVSFTKIGRRLLNHSGIITGGGSGSVLALKVKPKVGQKLIYKMIGIGANTRKDKDSGEAEAVYVEAFRNAVNEAQSITCN